ncbi:MAG: hypothetical protein N2V78_06600 [Methanophagales archaeon]|nr:hypothetical protein [Methanophagales archaeon]MCW3141591.1 hypothetical protein [Methanophagales archaeon]
MTLTTTSWSSVSVQRLCLLESTGRSVRSEDKTAGNFGACEFPPLLFRIGYAEPQKRAMPRRPLDAVLIEG